MKVSIQGQDKDLPVLQRTQQGHAIAEGLCDTRTSTQQEPVSLMVGRDLKLSGFVELSSLLLYAGWALPSCNMPAAHSIVTGSILNKQVYQADDKWGQPWDEISEAMRVYAVADIKYGWLVWVSVVGCLLRDLFLDPESVLFLTGVEQKEFVAKLNTLLLESLVGTAIQTTNLASARTREDVAKCICYRR